MGGKLSCTQTYRIGESAKSSFPIISLPGHRARSGCDRCFRVCNLVGQVADNDQTFSPIDRINSNPLLLLTTPSRNVKSNFILPLSSSSWKCTF
jgi:hypothetical protein